MKNILFVLVVCFASCCHHENNVPISQDSIKILKEQLSRQIFICDSLSKANKALSDSIYKAVFSVKIFDDRFKLAKIRRYIDICDKKPSNKVYFFGWIKRTMSD
jgi:hypothetical protein